MTSTADDDRPPTLRARMRADLGTAMKARDKDTVTALRTALAAFDDAEAVEAPPSTGTVASSEYVAGTTVGLGAAETARRELTPEDLQAILTVQVAQMSAEAQRYETYGRSDAAAGLLREADVLRGYIKG